MPDLARTIGTARQSAQRIVSELVGENLLVLTDNPRHRRAKLVRMADDGRHAYQAVMAAWAPQAALLEQQLGPDAARNLARSMTDLAGAFRTIADCRGRITGPTSSSQEEQQP